MARMVFDRALLAALKSAGLADDLTRRVVIDIQAGECVVAYVEKFTDETVLDVIPTLAGVQIKREPRTEDSA